MGDHNQPETSLSEKLEELLQKVREGLEELFAPPPALIPIRTRDRRPRR